MLRSHTDVTGRTVGIVLPPTLYKNKNFMQREVIARLIKLGVEKPEDKIVTFPAYLRADGKKPTKKELQPFIDELMEFVDTTGITTLAISNAQYFEAITGRKFEASIGTSSTVGELTVLPLVNPYVAKAQAGKLPLLNKSFRVLSEVLGGTYEAQDFNFKHYEMVKDPKRAKEILEDIKLNHPLVAWDIETTGLHHITSDIVTQALAPSEDIAYTFVMHEKFLGLSVAQEMHKIFKDFFHTYEGEVVVHNYGFESKFMMHKYVMSDYKDYRNMNKFIRKFKWGDTMLMAYALLNSTERTPLGLKDLAKDRYGDWDSDIDVKNALGQDIEKLCYYNAIDVSATLYIRRRILADISPSQLNFYETVMKDTQNLFTRIMVTGLPIDMQQVLKGEEELLKRQQELQETFYASSYVKEARDKLVATMVDKYNETHKKQIDADFYESIQFNYSSSNQLRVLLFDIMGYTPVELTKTKQASTAKAVIEELLDATQDESMKEVLQCLIGFSEVEIILSTFLRAMREDSIEVAPGVFKLYGNLRVGGTQTFRPTASAPNLLNVRAS